MRLSFMSDYIASKTLVMIDSIDWAFEVISLTRKIEIVPQKVAVRACSIFHKKCMKKKRTMQQYDHNVKDHEIN